MHFQAGGPEWNRTTIYGFGGHRILIKDLVRISGRVCLWLLGAHGVVHPARGTDPS